MARNKIGGRTITLWIDPGLDRRLRSLEKRMGKKTEEEKGALIWWLLNRGITLEEQFQDMLNETMKGYQEVSNSGN